MKLAYWPVDEWQVKRLRASRIKHKFDILEFLMQAVKIMLSTDAECEQIEGAKLCHVSAKMNRIILFDEKQYTSIGFPFTCTIEGKTAVITSKHIGDVDSKVTSDSIGILKENEHHNDSSMLVDSILETSGLRSTFLPFFLDLLQYEDGYIRYDHDLQHANGRLHPLDHLDIFYTNRSTFKLGLNPKPQPNDFIDILNTQTNAKYIDD